jgi:hypothetical protein
MYSHRACPRGKLAEWQHLRRRYGENMNKEEIALAGVRRRVSEFGTNPAGRLLGDFGIAGGAKTA